MPGTAFTAPPIPIHLAGFQSVGGLVIPFITLQHRNGTAALGLVDARRMELCLRERRCGVCGGSMPGRMVFFMRRTDLNRKCSVEPAMCPPCAAYTGRACPMITGNMAQYRRSVSSFPARACGDPLCQCTLWAPPDDSSARLGAQAEPWYALWTLQYRLVRTPEGHLAAGFAGLRVLRIREIKSSAASS